MPQGAYTYTAKTTIAGKAYVLSGEFMVKKVDIEYLETVANHRLLDNLSQQQGGKMIYPQDIEKLPGLLQAREDLKPIAYMQEEFKDLIQYKTLFFILLLCLSAEWFLRKYFGSY
jgi:hypothetical protein